VACTTGDRGGAALVDISGRLTPALSGQSTCDAALPILPQMDRSRRSRALQ